VLAPIYARMGRFDDAAMAWRRVAAGEGDMPEVQENLGEMQVAANDGIVDAEAAAAFEAAIAADPTRVKARFYRALSHAQAGRRQEALADYDEIIRLSPPDAPWLDTVRADRAAVLGEAPAGEQPGPDAAAVAAAGDMSEADRSAMIGGMVDGLAARLAEDPNDADGWERLIRAYGVLGRADDAKAAFDTASATFSSEPDVLAKIKAVADEAGVKTE
jgi:cytochrome c-type biogenesis protein CcmH